MQTTETGWTIMDQTFSGNVSRLRCCSTESNLTRSGDEVLNDLGEKVGIFVGPVLYFSSVSESETEDERARLRGLCQASTIIGWRRALQETYDEAFVRYVTDETRAIFIDYIPISKSHDVLEIGPGLGQFTSKLAERARTVDALEVVPEQAAFVATRVQQEGRTNVRVVAGGSECRLPYLDQSFDVVVMNLVFEWCASRLNESHEEVQRRMLSEINRVLRPGGYLYLATKNRFGVSYLLGKPDEHFDGMRFGSALPRTLGRILHGERQPGMLYSYPGLLAMLSAAGFELSGSWWLVPDYRYPEKFVATELRAVSAVQMESGRRLGRSRSEQILFKLCPPWILKYVMPNLNFLLQKRSL